MRRSLVLTDEGAGHPFLASLPPHIRSGKPARPARAKLRLTKADIRGFLTAYVGCFIAATLFFM